MLNVSHTEIEKHCLPCIPPWGEVLRGQKTLQALSVCHHKSAARLITVHLLLNSFLEEPHVLGASKTHIEMSM
eukprot:4835608-Lingulodinium_polyedra.AAC.1